MRAEFLKGRFKNPGSRLVGPFGLGAHLSRSRHEN
jgi:hypothetical protein